MINREAGVQEIYNRIKAARHTLGIAACKRTPTKPITEYKMPCVFIIEGVDIVLKDNSRNPLGYPSRRQLEVILEIIVERDVDIRALYTGIRSAVLSDATVAKNTFVMEIRTEGPSGYGLPDVSGMNLVLALTYTDNGTQQED